MGTKTVTRPATLLAETLTPATDVTSLMSVLPFAALKEQPHIRG